MLKRRIFAASLASVLALSSFSVSAFAADEKTPAYASKSDLQNLVKTCKDFKDKDLKNYGKISGEKFEKTLTYAEQVANNSKAEADEYAVAYLMLKAAEENVKNSLKNSDELATLIDQYRSIYDTNNILNEEVGDEIYADDIDETSYSNFAYVFGQAESVLKNKKNDTKAVTDAYEELKEARESLVELKTVTKKDFSKSLMAFEKALLDEYKYNSWERVEVSGSGTMYDGKTFGWSALFYHVASAYESINEQFAKIKDIKTLNETSDGEIVKAKEACDTAVAVLTHVTASDTSSYGREVNVLNIVQKEYATKIMTSDQNGFGKYVGAEYLLATILKEEDVQKLFTEANGEALEAKDLADLYNERTGKLELTLPKNTDLWWDDSEGKYVKDDPTVTDGDVAYKNVDKNVKINIMEHMDWFAALANAIKGNAGFDTSTGYLSATIYDGAPGHKSALASSSGAPENSLTDFVGVDYKKSDYDEDRDEKVDYTGSKDISAFKEKADSLKEETDARGASWVSLKTALGILTGEAYSDTNVTAEGVKAYGKKGDDGDLEINKTDRKELLAAINDAETISLGTDKMVSGEEWTLIGQYLKFAMSYVFDASDDTITLDAYKKMIDESRDLLETTAESTVFKAHHDALVTAVDDATAYYNSLKKSGETKVNKGTKSNTGKDLDGYDVLKSAKSDLEKDVKAFAYSYDNIYDMIATIAKSDEAKENESLYNALLDTAFKLAMAEDLTMTDGSTSDSTAAIVDGEFLGYNRVFTNDSKYNDYEKSNGGANQSHYDLKTAYLNLQSAYNDLTSPTTTKGDGFST